jgi:hypothetical protein
VKCRGETRDAGDVCMKQSDYKAGATVCMHEHVEDNGRSKPAGCRGLHGSEQGLGSGRFKTWATPFKHGGTEVSQEH